ncbi:hypothetical protein F2P56_004374 [Juglans regia]|uniref:Transcriptional regulator SUPERMAN n=2 Tax=Juglans regia TaxID=51240 RepID=A0A2I4EZ41_JUGRE|nr:transcriptional regulator SUPERMAN [Juglans regia]KAF5477758.1 hypothetical protein F2P56_004374 [Juglans regia]
MAAELGLLSLTQLQRLAQSQHQHYQLNPSFTRPSAGSWMWNPKQANEEDDSWEVRAFAEDTGNASGTTWPPRSYTCTFCRREFRSAQALGGHMNVHRRDRVRLNQPQPNSNNPISSSSSTTSSFIIPSTQEYYSSNGGLCRLYQSPNPNGAFTSRVSVNASHFESPSTLLSISVPSPPNNLMPPCSPSISYASGSPGTNSPRFYSSKAKETSPTTDNANDQDLDLELRLGQRPMSS